MVAMVDGVIDEAYERLLATGPEFDGWLSNHGPMAAEAMVRLGRGIEVEAWVGAYIDRLEDAPQPRWTITEPEWRDVLGDPSRLGDWCEFFAHKVVEEPWRELLSRWWPRLLPGAVASATHGLIRTGHAVRSLLEADTPARRSELGQGLAYWAARYQPLPDAGSPSGLLSPQAALDRLPAIADEGGMRARLYSVANSTWTCAVTSLLPVAAPAAVPEALAALVDAAVARYTMWGHGSPVMLVHAATAPRAMSLVLPALGRDLWIPSYEVAWKLTAAVNTAFRPRSGDPGPSIATPLPADEVTDRAVASGDEHAIKFVEVALESHHRGNSDALCAAHHTVRLTAPG